MKGKLIHTEHRSSDISEYYFNISTRLITEVKNLRFNKTKEYKYSIEQFSKSNQGSKIEKLIIKKANTIVSWLWEGQTAHRNNLNILSLSKGDILKVSPFYNYLDHYLNEYLKTHQLANEAKYYDPTI